MAEKLLLLCLVPYVTQRYYCKDISYVYSIVL